MKTFVLDTSVLLYHEDSIHGFPGQEVALPIEVLEELDTFKTRDDSKGNAARYINRFLDELRQIGSLKDGVKLQNGQIIRVSLESDISLLPSGFEVTNDNKIISVALKEARAGKNVSVISRDINFRIKCDILGIPAENYIKEKAVIERRDAYTGVSVVEATPSQIEDFYDVGYTTIDEEFYPNEFLVLKSDRQSALAIYKDKQIKRLIFANQKSMNVQGISPRNKEQTFAFEALLNPDIHMVTLTGKAGSGKTLIAVAAAVHLLQAKVYKKIIVSRSAQSMSQDIGFLPGDIKEKMLPWIQPIIDNFKIVFGDTKSSNYFELMMEKGIIEIQALSHIRGRSLPDTIFILDEAQNITYHEAKAVITRMGEGSKLIMLGDTEQIDAPHLDSATSGLTAVAEKFKDFDLSAHITLLKGERSKLATYAAQIM
jgi:PhoH-like ATPase